VAVAVGLIGWVREPTLRNVVSVRALEDSEYGVLSLEDHGVFVVATEDIIDSETSSESRTPVTKRTLDPGM
jgi:hypothetical protein